MAMGDGRHMLPVKIEIRRAIGKEGAPETADTHLTKVAHSRVLINAVLGNYLSRAKVKG
jgi:hypothetical protein